jgi:carbonic anhydrase/acetyltransferase-like protein (isoleucine patch superfamily)
MGIYQFEDRIPDIATPSFIAPGAKIIGSVVLQPFSSVWFNAVLRGDNDLISIGARSNIQDNAVLHTDPGIPLTIENDVTIGHSAMLHGCIIGEYSLVGIGSTILNNAKIGKRCIIGANSLITENKEFPDHSMIMGSPGRVIRQLSEEEMEQLTYIAEIYVKKVSRYQSLKKL